MDGQDHVICSFYAHVSCGSQLYRVYNLVSRKIEETINLKFLKNKPFVAGTGQAWMFDINYLTDSLNYSRVSSTNLTTCSQGATPSNAGSQEDNSDSNDEPDVLVIQSTPTLVVPIVDEAKSQNDGTKSDLATTHADNLDEPAELQALQRQELTGKEEADRLGLAFPSLNLTLGVGFASIGSFVSAGSTPLIFAVSTPPMSSPVSAGRPTGSAGKPVSAGRSSGSATRTPVPAGRSFGKLTTNPDWVEAMQAKMQQFRNQKVWVLVTLPDRKRAIGTKWILKNKRDSRGIICINKARLVAQGHRQEEGIDYTDVFAPVARIEAIRLFLAFALFIGFMVYQIDVKSAFLYEKVAEEVYVTQPRGFEDPYHPKKVYKVVKALYGLHQAPRAWYERLSTFLLKHRYRRGTIEKTLFIKNNSKYIMLVQVYVDDIIFGSTRKDWCEEFETLMHSEFEMSLMGPLTFFLGLQVDQRPYGIFIHQEKYVADILKKFDLDNSKLASTPFEPQKIRERKVPDETISVHLYRSMIGCLMYLTTTRPDIMFAVCDAARHQVTPKTSNLLSVKRIFKYLTAYPKLGLWYPRDSPFDLEAFSNFDYAGANGDKKSTTGGCQFFSKQAGLGFFFHKNTTRSSTSDFCKKQTIVATSSCEAEYVAAASCCGQSTWSMRLFKRGLCCLRPILLAGMVSAGGHSFLLYALTTNPTIYASVVRQFWGSASEVSLSDGVKGLVATIDSTAYTVTEASIRSALQLDDLNAIDTMTNKEIFAGLQDIGNIAIALICLLTGRKYNFSNMIFNDTDTEDTTPYPAPLVTKKIFANMRHYQGPDMPLLAHMLNLGEHAFEQAQQQQDVAHPPPSPEVASHPSPNPIPLPTRQSSHPPILFGPTPTSRVVSTDPILDISSSSRPSEQVLESITSPFRDDDTGGGSFHESLSRPHPATPTPTTMEAELKATKILHRGTVVLFAKRIKKLESKLKTKKRKLVLSDSEKEEEARQSQELYALLDLANAALHEPSYSTTPSKPANPEQSSEQEISPTTLDAVLTLSQSKAKARAATIIYKRLKKQQSSSGLNFTEAAIPAGELDSVAGLDSTGGVDSGAGLDSAGGVDSAAGLDSAGGVDYAGGLLSAGILVAADQQAAILEAKRQELLEQELKQSIDAEQVYLDSLLAQRVAEEQERESIASATQSTHRQAELDRVALNLTNEEWIGLVDQVRANQTLSAELLGADVSEDTFSVRMVELINKRLKAIAEMKAKAKREKPMTPAQKKEFMRTFVKNQSSAIYTTGWTWKDVRGLTDDQLQIRSGEPLESSESKKVKSSHNTTQPTELQEPITVFAGVPIAAGDPIPTATSVSTGSFILAATPIELMSPLLLVLLDLLDAPLRKSSRKKSIARKRTLPSPSQPKPNALPFDEDDPKAELKRADGTVKRFSTLRELMYWVGRADLMVLYDLVLDKYKIERATGSVADPELRILCPSCYSFCRALTMLAWVLNFLAFKLEEIVMAMMTCLKSSSVHYQCFTVKCGLLLAYVNTSWKTFTIMKLPRKTSNSKSEARRMENLNDTKVKQLRSDNGTKFRNQTLEAFCDEKGISQNFSLPCTPEQNGIAERINKTLIKAVRTMLNGARLPKQFGEKLSMLLATLKIDLSLGNETRRLPIKCSEEEHQMLATFMFLVVLFTFTIIEIIWESLMQSQMMDFSLVTHLWQKLLKSSTSEDKRWKKLFMSYLMKMMKQYLKSALKDRWSREKHIELVNIIDELLAGITARNRVRDSKAASLRECLYVNFLSQIEPKRLCEALEEEGWVLAMPEELNQFKMNKVWTLVPKPYGKTIIGLNVSDGSKSAFLNGTILEEVYVEQPLGFERSEVPNHFCKLNKALHGLKQAPRAWRVVPGKYDPKRARFLIAARFPTPPLASIVEPLCIELPFLEDQFQEDTPPESPMADNRTMAELLQAPTEGYEDAISKSKVRQSRAKAVVTKVGTSSSTPVISANIAKLKDMVKAFLLDKKNQSLAPTLSTTPAPVKAVEPNCVTCPKFVNHELRQSLP
nr:putative ribonuclease H-like domain-containing protein [Tanacetum cinerariifolium]